MERRYLSVKETAEYLGLSISTIYRLCFNGQLRSCVVRIGRSLRVDRRRLDECLEAKNEKTAI